MSIENEINRISTNVSDTLAAIEEMGGEVPEGATSNDMASAARTIPVGAKIDDTTPSATTTYSGSHIDALLNAQKEAIDAKVGADELDAAVEDALTEAKNSGDFKGDKGDKGDTPVKGTDYWTAADKQGIVSDVLAALPTWEGGSY